jgi:hypothetical protein
LLINALVGVKYFENVEKKGKKNVMKEMISFPFFFMSVYVKKTGLSICKDISEYNTMMTSLLKCLPASATKRTSCHTTDGDDDENDVNRSFYFGSILAVVDVLLFFFLFSISKTIIKTREMP